jgi:hypothetical protein
MDTYRGVFGNLYLHTGSITIIECGYRPIKSSCFLLISLFLWRRLWEMLVCTVTTGYKLQTPLLPCTSRLQVILGPPQHIITASSSTFTAWTSPHRTASTHSLGFSNKSYSLPWHTHNFYWHSHDLHEGRTSNIIDMLQHQDARTPAPVK